jgi:ATP-binding cassette subfamily B protein
MHSLAHVFRYLRRYRLRLAIGYVALAVSLGAELLAPLLIQYAIDSGIEGKDEQVLLYGALAILTIGIVQSGFTFMRAYSFMTTAEQVGTRIRADLFNHLLTMPFSFFDTAQSGQLISRATEDVRLITRMLGVTLRLTVYSLVMMVVVTILLLRVDVTLTLLSLLLMPFLLVTVYRGEERIRSLYASVRQQFGEVSTVLQENLAGARVVRAFARGESERAGFNQELKRLYDVEYKANRYWTAFYPLTQLLAMISLVIILWYGGRQVLDGQLSVGSLVAFNLYLTMLASAVWELGWVATMVARGAAASERVFDTMHIQPAIRDRAGAVALTNPQGAVRFESVSFRYPNSPALALREIDLEASPGEVIALLGPTGSGKTTLTNLIPRFYEATEGQVSVDGRDVRDYTINSLRRAIGIVMQESFLFSATIRENIAFGNPDASPEEIEAAAKIARAHDFITALPDGYDTLLGERGLSLSGGQRQRISIARALCSDPRILILDDATASVDTETESEIQAALRAAMVGRTTFVIAQRLATLKHADEIIVLRDGAIAERGTHIELLQRNGYYRRVYDIQFRDQEEFAEAVSAGPGHGEPLTLWHEPAERSEQGERGYCND